MSHPAQPPTKLNPLQQHLLDLFGRQEVTENDTRAIQQLISDYFFQKAEAELERVWSEKELSPDQLDKLADAHLRTPYTPR
ncbi:hypothetical protein ACO2Q8_25050 [Larkinella sp. VNQ87]|uniref:hypothetical protein n=1 Tax=Larkinella sp. VNQ87 TaxID=3400921 RepID=UPI003C0113D1